MRTSVRYFVILSLSGLLFSCSNVADNGASNATPETEDQKILNALGQALAQNVLGADLSEEELGFVQRGLTDAVLGQDALVPLDEYGPQIQGFMQQRMASAADDELALANAFYGGTSECRRCGTNRVRNRHPRNHPW